MRQVASYFYVWKMIILVFVYISISLKKERLKKNHKILFKKLRQIQ